MKKFFTLLLALTMCLSLAACGGGKEVVSGFDGTPSLNLIQLMSISPASS